MDYQSSCKSGGIIYEVTSSDKEYDRFWPE